jgi:hypothetical protein
LIAVLEAFDDEEMTADCRAALLECRDQDAHRAVLQWEQNNPHEPETGSYLQVGDNKVGPFFSMAEISLRTRQQFVRYEMEQLHERVMLVRERIPPESASPE